MDLIGDLGCKLHEVTNVRIIFCIRLSSNFDHMQITGNFYVNLPN